MGWMKMKLIKIKMKWNEIQAQRLTLKIKNQLEEIEHLLKLKRN